MRPTRTATRYAMTSPYGPCRSRWGRNMRCGTCVIWEFRPSLEKITNQIRSADRLIGRVGDVVAKHPTLGSTRDRMYKPFTSSCTNAGPGSVSTITNPVQVVSTKIFAGKLTTSDSLPADGETTNLNGFNADRYR